MKGYLKRDEDAHWFFIPETESDEFDQTLERCREADCWDEMEMKFGDYRLRSHPTSILFTMHDTY
jgi:hypothetical protein